MCRSRSRFAAALVLFGLVAFLTGRPATGWGQEGGGQKDQAKDKDSGSIKIELGEAAADQAATEERIFAAQRSTTKIDFEEKALDEVIAQLSKQHQIPIKFDEKALTDAAIATDTPITRHLADVSLKSALRHLLRPLQLTYVVENEVLLVTTQQEADQKLVVRVYPVADLCTPWGQKPTLDEQNLDYDMLNDLIQTIVAPTTWDTVGGPASLYSFHGSLIFSQTAEVHEQIADFLTALRKARTSQEMQPGGAPIPVGDDPKRKAIKKALSRTTRLSLEQAPLDKVIEELEKAAGIQIELDDKALTDAAIASDTPITFNAQNTSLASILDLVLHPLQLTYLIRDEVLLITTQQEADQRLLIRIYPVADLVAGSNQHTVQNRFEDVIHSIENTVAATTWDNVGGPGAIELYEGGLALAVSQTQEGHEAVEKLLATVRSTDKELKAKYPESAEAKPDDDQTTVLRVYVRWDAPPPAETTKPTEQTKTSQRGKRSKSHRLAQFGGGFESSSSAWGAPAGESGSVAEGLVRELIESQSWHQEGFFIRGTENRLLVRHRPSVQRRIEQLLSTLGDWRNVSNPKPEGGLRGGGASCGPGGLDGGGFGGGGAFAIPPELSSDAKADAADGAKKQRKGIRVYPPSSVAEQRIVRALEEPTDFEFNEIPLRDAIDFIKEKHGVDIQLDDKALTDSAIATDTPITKNIKGVSLRSALNIMLRPLGLRWVIQDEVLLITTRDTAAQIMELRVYDVSEVVDAGEVAMLSETIRQTVEPASWNKQETMATVVPFASRGKTVLVVRQSARGHEQVLEFVASLRAAIED